MSIGCLRYRVFVNLNYVKDNLRGRLSCSAGWGGGNLQAIWVAASKWAAEARRVAVFNVPTASTAACVRQREGGIGGLVGIAVEVPVDDCVLRRAGWGLRGGGARLEGEVLWRNKS